ncbi:TetR/AcrR family transcriptional regulator [Salinibacterium hongtaonis]|uniref:TetR/AcrR family transcriptional regulator n=1 Tax=Homoserinimonas hongtaonis TaxID=2079791 RepID=UPI000D3536D1|nr:TetR/AcrR family transcriptional regulator [Salinibacterium hongtaonis]AWB90219.1 hypothetical protein C2138_12280 [Salinibacterium hongtaonis]
MTNPSDHSDTEKQRNRALEATLALVTRSGYRATTLAGVARESAVSESFILWHFRNKDRLFAEALDHSYRERRLDFPSWSEVIAPGHRSRALRDNLDGLSSPTTKGTEYRTFGLMLGLVDHPIEPTARQRFIEYRGLTLAAITGWWNRALRIEDGEDRDTVARLLAEITLAAVDGRFVNAVETEFDPVTTSDIIADGLEALATLLEEDPAVASTMPLSARQSVETLPAPLPSSADPDSTRVQILRAAERVAAGVGIDATSIARICKESGSSPTSIYWFFRDRNAIFESLIGFLHDDWNATHRPHPSHVDARWVNDPLIAGMAHMLWRHEGATNLIRISMLLLLYGGDAHIAARDECLRVRALMREEWASTYSRAVPDLALAANERLLNCVALVHASISDGLLIAQQLNDHSDSMTSYTSAIGEFMRAAIRKQLIRDSSKP